VTRSGSHHCVLVALLVVLACERAQQPPVPPLPPPEDATLDRVEAGPYELDGVPFTLVTHIVRHAGEQSVHALQLVDREGRVHHEASFERPEVATWGLEFTLTVTAWPVRATSGDGLLLSYEFMPSAPMTGESVQGFGVRGGTLRPLWPPLEEYGELQLPGVDATGARGDGDVILKSWRYHFGLLLPLAIDWSCAPGSPTCVQLVPPRADTVSGLAVFDVWTDLRTPTSAGSITLYAAPLSDAREVLRVLTTSAIEVIEAAASASLSADQRLGVTVRDEFLRVRIDGREGWIRGPEDFEAIGLPGAG
jgi:hypothetical protein